MFRCRRSALGISCIPLALCIAVLQVLSPSPKQKVLKLLPRAVSDGMRLGNNKLGLRRLTSDRSYEQRFHDLQIVTGESTSTIVSPNQSYIRPKFNYSKEPRIIENSTCFPCASFEKSNWTMVSFIKSAAGNFWRRELLRRTWGSVTYVERGRFITVFVVGHTEGITARILEEEHQRYGDILQYDGPDDYRSMPLKTLAAMQWANDHLDSEFLYSSGDDDFMINLGHLQNIVDNYRRIVTQNTWPEFPLICTYRTLVTAKPYRNKTGTFRKWAIGEDEYKWPYYPKCCLGGFYTMSVSVAGQLQEIARTTPALHVDDVWITGILREKLGMPDEMVITPEEKIAHHFTGYRRKRSKTKIDFMKKEWTEIFDKFKNKSMCSC